MSFSFFLLSLLVPMAMALECSVVTSGDLEFDGATWPTQVKLVAPAGVKVQLDSAVTRRANATRSSVHVDLVASAGCSLGRAALVVKENGFQIDVQFPNDVSAVDAAAACDAPAPALGVDFECPTEFVGCGGGPTGGPAQTATQATGPTTSATTSTTFRIFDGQIHTLTLDGQTRTSATSATSTASSSAASSSARETDETRDSSASALSRTAAAATTAVASALLSRNAFAAPIVFAALGGCGAALAQSPACAASLRVSVTLAGSGISAPTADECAKPPPGTEVLLNGVSAGTISKILTPGPKVACGRPFVVDDVAVLARASDATSDARAARWVSQGLGEHASVASFAAFSLQLMVNGAPFALLAGAARANGDEVRHAEQSFALASRFAGRAITAEAFPRRAVSALEPQTLEQLAESALREGCIAETLSVFDAARQIERGDVADAEERAVLAGIVRDEARHSALAWRSVAWASGSARNETLNARLAAVVADEHARCAGAAQCALFERLIVPLAQRVIGARDWQQIVDSDDVEIVAAEDNLTEGTIVALIKTFA